MNDAEIEEALTASGLCEPCGGRGKTYEDDGMGGMRDYECGDCDGTGRDPFALLRAVQAVGLLLLRRPT